MSNLELPTVTLCAATSVNVAATIAALRMSLDRVAFADALLFTHAEVPTIDPRIRVIIIEKLRSAADYSNFLLNDLVHHITTDHCLVVQWDGFVINPEAWRPAFLDQDYIGAIWPQFDDGHQVGNGGFSLRSRRLLEACSGREFKASHPEDVAIGRLNRTMLEDRFNLKFAEPELARRFSYERDVPDGPTFGFHGVFNLIPELGAEAFWRMYRTLDEPTAILADYRRLMRQLGTGSNAWYRRRRLTTLWLQEKSRGWRAATLPSI